MIWLDIYLLMCSPLGDVTEVEGKASHKTDLFTRTGIGSEILSERSNRKNS